MVCDSSSSLFSLISGYHASYLAIILSHLNVLFFHIYSTIVAVFLTMALLYRCLLAYRLKKRRMFACSSCFFLLAPKLPSFHLSTSDSRTERFFQTMPQAGVYGLNQVYNRGGGGHTVHTSPQSIWWLRPWSNINIHFRIVIKSYTVTLKYDCRPLDPQHHWIRALSI